MSIEGEIIMWQTVKSWLGIGSQPQTLLAPEKKRSSQWPKVRAAFLAKNPFCAACGETDKKKLEVHHAWPWSWPGGELLELSEENFIVLCDNPGFS